MTRPCDRHPTIPCATGGRCFGVTYWSGKPARAKPLSQTAGCLWEAQCAEWLKRQQKEGGDASSSKERR